ncbi:hypothetical protein [Winogradskyella vidalii]|uniref:hypothetical protein n=1 Tax=Winogradskyella vidalii TaxID=2615024 RepID=UPI0015C6AC6D|nr:hypothetical protein [Winogradskyella vidalii]
MKKIIGVLVITFLLVGCETLLGEEIGRLVINEASNSELHTEETSLSLKKGEKIAFWTDTDIVYKNDLALVYILEIWKDSTQIGRTELDALNTNPRLMEVKKVLGNTTTWRYSGKMKHFSIKEDGNYTFKAILKSSDNPTLKINKAELVLKK